MKHLTTALLILLLSSTSNGQKNSDKKENKNSFKGFDQTKGGLYYKITKAKEPGRQIALNDIVEADMKYGTDDTTFFNTEISGGPMQLMVVEPVYSSDVIGGFTLLRVGDDAIFKTSADTFFKLIAQMPLPEFVPENSWLTFYIKINKAQTSEELEAERQIEAQKNKELETALITRFVTENNVAIPPTPSGLYYIEREVGGGKPAVAGTKVAVHYSGLLLTGEPFDNSYERGEPLVFTMGSGQIIPGFDEGVSYMKVGGKATFIIPSALAYGEQGPQGTIIGDYAPLRFDVELLEVTEENSDEGSMENYDPAGQE